jgi:hypothetical protein
LGPVRQSCQWLVRNRTVRKKRAGGADYSTDIPGLGRPLTLRTGVSLDNTHRYIHRPDLRGNIPVTTGSALAAHADPNFTQDVALGFGPYLPQNQSFTLPLRYFEFGEPHLTLGFRGRF